MSLDFDLLCETSGWKNNCGVNCLSHFLTLKIQSGELQEKYAADPSYESLLKTFQEYYPNQFPTWENIRQQLNTSSDPRVHEIFLGPVLRKHLGKVLLSLTNEIWDSAAGDALTEYLQGKQTRDIAHPFIYSNQTWFVQLKKQYDQDMLVLINYLQRRKKTIKTIIPLDQAWLNELKQQYHTKRHEEQANKNKRQKEKPAAIAAFVSSDKLLTKMHSDAKMFWEAQGCKAYADYMANLDAMEMISADILVRLCEKLHISTEVYLKRENENNQEEIVKIWESSPKLPWHLKLQGCDLHWQYEEPNKNKQATIKHNQYYHGKQDDNESEVYFNDLYPTINIISKMLFALLCAYIVSLLSHYYSLFSFLFIRIGNGDFYL